MAQAPLRDPAIPGTEGARRLSALLSRATVLVLLAVALSVTGGLFWATERSDDLSVERQERVTWHAIHVALDELALQQEAVAIWDESAEHMVAEKRDLDWLFGNTGLWLFNMFKHDETWLLDEQDWPVQVVVNGKRASLNRYWELKGSIAPLLRDVRQGPERVLARHDRGIGGRTGPTSTVRTTSRTVHDTHLVLVGGRPAAASVMLMKPSTEGYVGARSRWPAMVSIRYLDSGFMAELKAKHLIDGPRFSRRNDAGEGESALLIREGTGEALGWLIWRPELPGSRITTALLPANVAGLALLGLLMFVLVRRLNFALQERGRLEERSAHLAVHDGLTGLANRSLLSEKLAAALGTDRQVALLLIDLDRFKQVNDTLGHLVGDELIRQFAARLRDTAGEGDILARLGGDEFAVLLLGSEAQDVVDRCETILSLFARPFDLLGHSIFGGASIGAAVVDGQGIDSNELMRRADVALYRAKADGRNCARLFRPRMDAAAKRRARLESDLRRALGADQFALWSQSQVDRHGRIVGHELLFRWHHPELGLVSPDRILPIAEESGLIGPIGDWVLHRALAFAVASKPGNAAFTALNLSPAQLRDETFAERVVHHCRMKGIEPARIELEITERTLLDDSRVTRASLQRLRQAGFRIALDDFGTGYSSLSYLRRLKVDKIKIDRSFVADVETSADARAIIAAIVTLGRALGLTIAAEGVETERQEDILLLAGCDQLQGHLYARAAPIDERLLFAA